MVLCALLSLPFFSTFTLLDASPSLGVAMIDTVRIDAKQSSFFFFAAQLELIYVSSSCFSVVLFSKSDHLYTSQTKQKKIKRAHTHTPGYEN